jgi:hypothetical protein
MRIIVPVLLTIFLAPLAAAQAVRVDAAPWTPGGGPVRVTPEDPGRTPLAEKQAPVQRARSHLHPGDAQRRQDERDLADALAAQQMSNAEAAIATQKIQREIQNQQFSNEMRAEQAQRDRSALQFQLNAQQQNFIPLQLPRPPITR